MSSQRYVAQARELPSRLLAFFTKYPPAPVALLSSNGRIRKAARNALEATSNSDGITTVENTSSSDANLAASSIEVSVRPNGNATRDALHNPFLPWKNASTGNWRGPVYSLRRQAELFKLAAQHNVLSLMPLSAKHPEVREQKRIENGLRVQGTGVGKKVKGKLWERTLKSRLEKRRKAMEGMPAMIKEWKERGHGRGWKKWPK